MSIVISVLPNEVGVQLLENGNVGVHGLDRQANMIVQIEFGPEAWRSFVKNAGRLRGAGIPHAAGTPLYVPGNGNDG